MQEKSSMRIIVDGQPIEFASGDSVLIAMLRAGRRPTVGGCLCLAGDCPHCLATVDGVAYVRTCQTPTRAGMIVESFPADGYPPLPQSTTHAPAVTARNIHCDVVVIGQGKAGQAAAAAANAAGQRVVTLDAGAGQEVIGIYAGPLVVARTPTGMLHVHAQDEIIVATGAAEIQPVAPGNDLPGILTPRAAKATGRRPVWPFWGASWQIGALPLGSDAEVCPLGELVRFEGADRLQAVVTRGRDR
jgi:hypothetical protein